MVAVSGFAQGATSGINNSVSLNRVDGSKYSLDVADLQGVDSTAFLQNIYANPNFMNRALSQWAYAIDSAHNYYKKIGKAVTNSNISPIELLDAQQDIASFSITTQLFSKSLSLLIKDVDTLTRIQ